MAAIVEGSIVKQEADVTVLAHRSAPGMEWSREQIDLIKRTVCPNDASDDELKLFMHVAKTSGLDPLRKQIHCTKRSGKLVIIAGIDGLQARAAREPDYEGILHGVVCQKDEFQYDATTGRIVAHTYNAFADRGPIVGAWATVRRKGLLPFTALARFNEYHQSYNPSWKSMPTVMIDKVARSTALRMAYPEQFSSIYEPAEMDQAEPPAKEDEPKSGSKASPPADSKPAPKPTPAPPSTQCAETGHEYDIKTHKCQICGVDEGEGSRIAKEARGLPPAASKADTAKQPPALRQRVVKLWKHSVELGMTQEKFQSWMERTLERNIPDSTQLTEADVGVLEDVQKASEAKK